MPRHDVCIVGAGVVGAAIARALRETRPGLDVIVLEKEREPALHQSGRNSGVVHVGYNQAPGTLKAKLVVEGSRRTREYCRARGVPLSEGGVLVAGSRDAEPVLRDRLERGRANGARVEWVDRPRIRELEPAVEAEIAIHAPEGATFDGRAFTRSILEDATADVRTRCPVLAARETCDGVELDTPGGAVSARVVVNAAGLHADRVARLLGCGRGVAVIPFRGAYWEVNGSSQALVRSQVYPAPDPAFPFLGVHLSRKPDGRVIAGPGAAWVPGREAYAMLDASVPDVACMIGWRGFRRLVLSTTFLRLARREWRKALFVSSVASELRRLVPAIRSRDLVPQAAGIRAQLVDRDGRLVDDLAVEETPRSIHVLNAVSPALTCALPFGEHVASRVLRALNSSGRRRVWLT